MKKPRQFNPRAALPLNDDSPELASLDPRNLREVVALIPNKEARAELMEFFRSIEVGSPADFQWIGQAVMKTFQMAIYTVKRPEKAIELMQRATALLIQAKEKELTLEMPDKLLAEVDSRVDKILSALTDELTPEQYDRLITKIGERS